MNGILGRIQTSFNPNDPYREGQSVLFEQVYKRKVIYYHASNKSFDCFKSSPLFFSRDLEFIQKFYLDRFQKSLGFLYSCKILKNVNLFNPSCNSDYDLIIPKLNKIESQHFIKINNILEKCKNLKMHTPEGIKELIRIWPIIEEPSVQSVIKNSGFDGFAANNSTIDNHSEFIAIYDSNIVKIIAKEKYDFLNGIKC